MKMSRTKGIILGILIALGAIGFLYIKLRDFAQFLEKELSG